MEGMFVDGDYPDFSLLKEVLLPPSFESEPCSTVQSEITVFEQSQFRERPQDVDVASNESGQATESTLQYRRRSSRGRKKRGANNRSPLVKIDHWGLPGNHCKSSQKIGHKISCVPEPSIIYLLEESMKKLPKKESNLDDDQVSMNEDFIRNPSVKNGYRMTPCSSTMTSNAMELLNLINMKCTHLNKLEGDHLRIDVDHQWKNGGDGYTDMMKDNIPNSDVFTLDSANKLHKVQDSERGIPIINGGFLSEDRTSSTSSEVSSVERDEDPTGECSLLNTSTDYKVCERKTPRKQIAPTKGVEKQDPSFQGIEFQMQLCFEKKCNDCQLIVTSFYRRGRSRRKSTKSRLRFKSTSLTSGSEDDQPATSRNKKCASCKTQKTPLWRDAEDGTPLCNACGIRYKKYGMRCGQCWNIPKKDGKTCSRYCGCGGMFRAPV